MTSTQNLHEDSDSNPAGEVSTNKLLQGPLSALAED